MSYHQRILPQFQIRNQDTLPVLNPKVPHLTYLQRNLPQLQIMNQVNISVYIPHHSLLRSHHSILLPISTPFSSPHFFHQNCLLSTHQWNLSWLQLLLPVLIPVPFLVNTPQVYSCLLLYLYYPALQHNYILLYNIMYQTLHPQSCHKLHSQESYLKTPALLLTQSQVFVYFQL